MLRAQVTPQRSELTPVLEADQIVGEEVRVSIDEFRGHVLLDIRVFADFTPARVRMPTKKGISIQVVQLPDLIKALQDAAATARKLGLLSDGR